MVRILEKEGRKKEWVDLGDGIELRVSEADADLSLRDLIRIADDDKESYVATRSFSVFEGDKLIHYKKGEFMTCEDALTVSSYLKNGVRTRGYME